eukprot:GFUD01052041.1.p1 GENE.GFUD01052041.1~~GFUD01052041.1.p1  ORF type:complete len:110 (+),score=26.50 GFUD01052041.1:176-505(+)
MKQLVMVYFCYAVRPYLSFSRSKMCSKIAVVLSGCGVYDGSEVHEAAAALAAVSRAGYEAACFAPNRLLTCAIDHLTGETLGDTTRNSLVEAARISRAKLSDLEVKIIK